jgi:hypothetical protein
MDSERPIEKLLRAWAKKRRQGADVELHPATRRLLQGEVARTLGKKIAPEKSSSTWFSAVWPRFAWGLGLFAVLALVVWIAVPPSREVRGERRMAKHESPTMKDTFAENAPPAPPSPASSADSINGVDTRAQTELAMREKELAERKLSQPPSGTVAQSSLVEQKQEQDKAGSVAIAAGNKNMSEPTLRFELADQAKRDREELAAKAVPGGTGPATSAPSGLAARGNDRGIVTITAANGQFTNTAALASSVNSTDQQQLSPRIDVVGFAGAGSTQQPMVAAAPAAAPAPSARPGYSFSGPAGFGGARAGSRSAAKPSGPGVADTDLSVTTDGLQMKDKPGTSGVWSATLAVAAPTQPAPEPTRYYATKAAAEPTNVAQRFARLDTKAKASAIGKDLAAKGVLTSFEITRIGSEVRVVDVDGSVYTGYVQPFADVSRSRTTKAQDSPSTSESLRSAGATVEHSSSLLSDAQSQSTQNYLFRVVGTNLTVNESVVFSGQLIAATDFSQAITVTNSPRPGGGAGRATFREARTSASAPPAVSTRITGKVTVGKSKETDLNAVQTVR